MSRGHQRERDRVNWYRARGWFAMRAPASLGPVDVVAIREGEVRFEELKSNVGSPYKNFPPKDRDELSHMAEVAGAEARLVHWPPRKQPTIYPSEVWPNGSKA